LKCQRCRQFSPQGAWYCIHCGHALTSDTIRLGKSLGDKIRGLFKKHIKSEFTGETIKLSRIIYHHGTMYYVGELNIKELWDGVAHYFNEGKSVDVLCLTTSQVETLRKHPDFARLHNLNVFWGIPIIERPDTYYHVYGLRYH
jgi:hypothetical protein